MFVFKGLHRSQASRRSMSMKQHVTQYIVRGARYASRGIGQQHRAAEKDNETSLPEMCMDYFYMSDETEVRPLPHIVLKCSKTQKLRLHSISVEGCHKVWH